MFDVGFSELLLLAIVALVVLGPEKLPHAARVAGAWVARIRRTLSTMQTEIEREVAAQEVRQALEKQFKDMGGQEFAKGLAEERRDIENTLNQAGAALQDSPASPPLTIDFGIPPLTIDPATVASAAAVSAPAAIAAQATTDVPAPSVAPAATATAIATATTAASATTASAVDSAEPVLPRAATPPDEVRLDGEAAYREWLAAQRRENRIAPPAPDAGKDSPA